MLFRYNYMTAMCSQQTTIRNETIPEENLKQNGIDRKQYPELMAVVAMVGCSLFSATVLHCHFVRMLFNIRPP